MREQHLYLVQLDNGHVYKHIGFSWETVLEKNVVKVYDETACETVYVRPLHV